MRITTKPTAYVANSGEYKWTPMDIQVQLNTFANLEMVASTEFLLTKDDALELIEELKKVLDKLDNQ